MDDLGYSRYRDWKRWHSNSFGICSREASIYYAEELRRAGVLTVSNKTVVEIGFGNGEFWGWASEIGANYLGTEVIEELVQQGVDAGFAVQLASQPIDAQLGESTVDLFVAFDVFEHLELDALRDVLRSAYRVLRPSGMLVARVPSGDSPFSRAIQHGDVTHRLAIGSSMVRQLGNEAGFLVKCIREPALPLFGLGWKAFCRRLLVKAARRLFFPIVTGVCMGGGRPVLSPNMVFVLEKS
jgi:SAM-dependent methyltransferase